MKTLGQRILEDEMLYPDWREKLERGLRELEAGKGVELEEYLKQSRKRQLRPKRQK